MGLSAHLPRAPPEIESSIPISETDRKPKEADRVWHGILFGGIPTSLRSCYDHFQEVLDIASLFQEWVLIILSVPQG